MVVPWMLLTPAFVPRWSASPARPCTQRVPSKTGVRSFSWQGMDWCGGQPGGDRGGAVAGQVAFVCYFLGSEGREGQGRRLPTKGAYTHPPPSPRSPPLYNSCSDLVLSKADEGFVCVYGRFCVCVSV